MYPTWICLIIAAIIAMGYGGIMFGALCILEMEQMHRRRNAERRKEEIDNNGEM